MAGAQRAEEVLAHRRAGYASPRLGRRDRASHRAQPAGWTCGSTRRFRRRCRSGAGTALFVCGTCFAPAAPIASLTLLVDGDEQALMAHGMPRLDLLRASEEPTSYRAGFWGLARIGPREPARRLELGLRARLRGRRRARWRSSRASRSPSRRSRCRGAPLVAIAMATFEPPLDLFRRQVESIRAQTLTDWICVVSDDCSDPARFAELRAGARR